MNLPCRGVEREPLRSKSKQEASIRIAVVGTIILGCSPRSRDGSIHAKIVPGTPLLRRINPRDGIAAQKSGWFDAFPQGIWIEQGN